MIETDVVKGIPFEGGHYGGPANTVGGTGALDLHYHSLIPLGYFYGQDVCIDDVGQLRARPQISYLVAYAAASTAIPCAAFKLGGYYFTIPTTNTTPNTAGGTVAGAIPQMWSGSAWANVTSMTQTYTKQVCVDFTSLAAGSADVAMVGTGVSDPLINYVTTTDGAVLTPALAKGLCGIDWEDRLFCYNGGYMYYSNRGNYNSGYTEYFTLGPSSYPVIGMFQVSGSLYVVKQGMTTDTILIFKKSGAFSKSTDLIDHTSFTSPMGSKSMRIENGFDGLCSIGGTIVGWGTGQGLGFLTENGLQVDSQALMCGSKSNDAYIYRLANVDSHRVILAKPMTGEGNADILSYCYAYDLLHKCWYKWTIDLRGKGFGYPGGMFTIKGTKSPVTLGDYPVAASPSNDTIAPLYYSPVMNFDYPDNEKFLNQIRFCGRGLTRIDVYRRKVPSDSFTLDQTLVPPMGAGATYLPQIINLGTVCRFGELYLKLTGDGLFQMKSLSVRFDVGRTILEVT